MEKLNRVKPSMRTKLCFFIFLASASMISTTHVSSASHHIGVSIENPPATKIESDSDSIAWNADIYNGNIFHDDVEMVDSTALISRPGHRDRIYCYKKDDPNPMLPMSVKVRRKRFVVEGSFWGVRTITYKIRKAILVMPERIVRKVLRRAFDVWEASTPLKFVHKHSGDVDIEILFAKGAHGDGEPFDGKGRILAHAFFPRYGGDVHFDAAEAWSPNKYGRGLDLYAVAVHEIGHALGLKHSTEVSAIMAPFYQQYTGSQLHLHKDDINAMRLLYGSGESLEDNKVLLDSKSSWTQPPPDVCSGFKLDAVTTLGNGTVLAFIGEWVYTLSSLRTFDTSVARRVDEVFPGLDGDFDAVLTDQDGDSYFFKNEKYWLVNSRGKLYHGYPKKIASGLVDVPRNIDAAFVWNFDENAYFFKNDKYWRYSTHGMPPGYPKPIASLFPHIRRKPHRIDAAVTLHNGDTFLFSGDHYYKLLPSRMIVAPGYPRRTSTMWFNCHRHHRRPHMIENKRFV